MGIEIPKSTTHRHIEVLESLKNLIFKFHMKWKKIYLTKRINPCDLHLKRNKFDPFFKRIITSDEKWIVYNKVV